MKRVCAWCRKELRPREEYVSEGDITHGICSACALDLTGGTPRTAREILGMMDEPVFVIDGEGVVKAANRSGAAMLRKDLGEIEDHLGGDAFECSYAKVGEGCGNTVHCKTCAIRNIVMDTLATGTGYREVPAFQSIEGPDGPAVVRFRISTERVGERILLRIDRAG